MFILRKDDALHISARAAFLLGGCAGVFVLYKVFFDLVVEIIVGICLQQVFVVVVGLFEKEMNITH